MNEDLLSIIIPVFNEGENIKLALNKIILQVKYKFEILIIYDFDEDDTLPIAREMQNDFKFIKLIKNKSRGVLNAIKTGFENAKSKYIAVTMADLSDPPEVINKMLESAEKNNAAVVCASRYIKGGKQIGGPFIKGLMSKTAGLSLYYFAKVPTHDATNNFKLYLNKYLKSVEIESKGGFELGLELVVKAYELNLKISEVPTEWTDRSAGKSHFKILAWLPHYLRWYFKAYKVLLLNFIKGKHNGIK